MMKLMLSLILAFSCVFAHDISDELIEEINSKQNLWKAGRNFHKDIPMSKIRSMINTKFLSEEELEHVPIIIHDESAEIPESFDARTKWSNCKTIGVVPDQGSCKACWAISTAAVINDRICIHSDGKLQPVISARYILSCEPKSFGCEGGYPLQAFKFWKNMGLVTGGDYGSKIGCQPYPFPSCDHYLNGSKPICLKDFYDTPACVKTCENSIKYLEDLSYAESYYTVESNETQIQLEILKNGPVVASMLIYDDFIFYKSGIYAHTDKIPAGSHNVRVIGWGVENGKKYWKLVNPWNEDWGETGTMRILRGVGECDIEKNIFAALPKLTKL